MALCACTPVSEVITRGCCCCCSCHCHEAKSNIRAPCSAPATSEADVVETPSTSRHAGPSREAQSSQASHGSISRPSSRISVPSLCSACALKGGGRGRQHHLCRCSHCCSCSCSAPSASLLSSLLESHPFLSCLPIVDERTDEEWLADAITKSGYPGSFAWAKESSPCNYARLCHAGFLPIAERFVHSAGDSSPQLSATLLLPKLHLERMCLLLKMDKGVVLASKNLRRKARHYLVSVDRAFDERTHLQCRRRVQVLAGCVRRHGENWLWKSVRQCLRALHRRTLRDAALRRQREDSPEGSSIQAYDPGHPEGKQAVSRSPCPEDVQLHSFEVWVPLSEIVNVKLLPLKTAPAEETGTSAEIAHGRDAATIASSEALAALGASPRIGEPSSQYKNLCLVAGEVGVSVGSVYTSLTAFTDADSAGTTQLTATRLLLRRAGYELLDLGMNLPYKASLGAKPLPREVFLKLFRRLRDRKAEPLDATMQHCYESAQAAAQRPHEAPEQPKGKWNRGKDEASRASKEHVKEPSESAAVNRLSVPPGFVRSVDLFKLLDVP